MRVATAHVEVPLVLMSGSCAAGPRTLRYDQCFSGGGRRSGGPRAGICGAGSMSGGGRRRSGDADARAAVNDSRRGGATQRLMVSRQRTGGASQRLTVSRQRTGGASQRLLVLISKLTTRVPLLTHRTATSSPVR